MWKDKGLQLVMLPTKEKSLLWCHKGRTLRYNEANFNYAEDEERYFLYLLSDEEIITRDWVIDIIDNSIFQIQVSESTALSKYKKVIACLDPSLNLPQFPSSFIEEYVKRYNSKKSLEVEVEYMCGYWMVQENNIISIRFKEEKMYSKSEVEELCRNAFRAGEAYRTGEHIYFKQIHPNENAWIKENLK